MAAASLTKLMTMILMLESYQDQLDTISITAPGYIYDYLYGKNASTADIWKDETHTLRSLLYAMLLPSANEAAYIVADYMSGSSIDNFVAMMNDEAARIGCTGWFGELFLSYGFLAYVAIIIALGASYFLNHTRPGLHLRAVGESASTADAAGINVTKYKYLATCIGSMIAGLGGLYYVRHYAPGVWSNTAFGDRGWLAIALVIFTIWRPNVSILASILFGGLYILNIYLPTGAQMAVKELYKMLPYVITLIVLIIVSLRKKREDQPPASLGLSYFREER